jgi:hypothetical protein
VNENRTPPYVMTLGRGAPPSEIEEKQATKPLLLKRRRRVLPEVGFCVRRMRTQAACAGGTDLRGLGLPVLAPRGREQIEVRAAVPTAHAMLRHRRENRCGAHGRFYRERGNAGTSEYYARETTRVGSQPSCATEGSPILLSCGALTPLRKRDTASAPSATEQRQAEEDHGDDRAEPANLGRQPGQAAEPKRSRKHLPS